MDVDEGGRGADTKELLDSILILSKYLEIMNHEGISEVIKESQGLKYLSKVI